MKKVNYLPLSLKTDGADHRIVVSNWQGLRQILKCSIHLAGEKNLSSEHTHTDMQSKKCNVTFKNKLRFFQTKRLLPIIPAFRGQEYEAR